MANDKKVLTDIAFVRYLSNGKTVKDISEITKIGIRTLEARLVRIRKQMKAKNQPHIVGEYFRKKLIK